MIKLKDILLEYTVGKWRKNDPALGYYRISGKFEHFGQIKKASEWDDFKGWLATIRNKNGKIRSYAGIWKSLKDAKEEIEHTLKYMDEL